MDHLVNGVVVNGCMWTRTHGWKLLRVIIYANDALFINFSNGSLITR